MIEQEEKEHYVSMLEDVSIFSALDRESMLELYEQCPLKHCSAGEMIMVEDSPAEEIYIILEGEVKIVLDHNGDAFEITRIGVGNCIGETSVIGVQNHSASVIANQASTFLVLSRELIFKLYDDAPKIFGILILNIARELARRLKKTDTYLEDFRKHYEALGKGS